MEKFACLSFSTTHTNGLLITSQGDTTPQNFNVLSNPKTIYSSVIQGLVIGPIAYAVVAYAVVASDLSPIYDGNVLIKYADDTYLIVPPFNIHTCLEEIAKINTWANSNNLTSTFQNHET